MMEVSTMTLGEALRILNIEDYGERILYSNSRGELFHICDYILIAEALKDNPGAFRPWFVDVVAGAEKTWQRPESVFQHIPRLMEESLKS